MSLLFYWRRDIYEQDCAVGFGYNLNQNSPAMTTVQPGESVWAFTQRRSDGVYVLVAELIAQAVTRNPPDSTRGRHRIWGNLDRSRYFDAESGPDVEPVIRSLTTPTGGQHLGQAFQGRSAVRPLSPDDHERLAAFAANLRLHHQPAAGDLGRSLELQPSDGDNALAAESLGERKRRQEDLYERVLPARNRQYVEYLHETYGGRCQLCLFDPLAEYDLRLCEAHHLHWLSLGGEDELTNMVLLCPNHHALVHRDNAAFDFDGLTFRFSRLPAVRLQLNQHLPNAS